jgi:hypothetical protein
MIRIHTFTNNKCINIITIQQERVEKMKQAEQDRVSRSVMGGSPPKESTESPAARRRRASLVRVEDDGEGDGEGAAAKSKRKSSAAANLAAGTETFSYIYNHIYTFT